MHNSPQMRAWKHVSALQTKCSTIVVRHVSKGPRKTERGRDPGYFSVDRSGLFSNNVPDPSQFQAGPNRESATPLAKEISSLIQWRGPISMHDYMALALHHSGHGYYHSKKEKIGSEGDFVTAPELSQVFGEILALWCYSAFLSMGRPPRLQLVELGPGRGTLMQDMLRVLCRLPDFKQAVHVHMLEASQSLRREQMRALYCNAEAEGGAQTHEAGQGQGQGQEGGQQGVGQGESEGKVEDGRQFLSTAHGVPVTWSTYLAQVPEGDPMLVLGQEFLDAFPVHQFVYTQGAWREKLVDLERDPNSKLHFRIVLAKQETPAVKTWLNPERGFVEKGKVYDEGAQLELSPLSISTCTGLAQRILKGNGAALLIDYGHDHAIEDSMRAFKRHQQVSFLSEPGAVDMTADVDFQRCRAAATSAGAVALPLQTQGRFLMSLGIAERVGVLMNRDETSEEEAEKLLGALKMLVESDKMGEKFKVLGIAHPSIASQLIGFQ